ncbi:unnamed protein product [Ranitomeya imitator]|uniref:Glycosyl hydrolase family 31 C-terminal domain-containing protein n=1 Tax=Ranitomeya imitator TaxID=111125 RepID=A0ABN9LH85_9NEOB|nr:unnamed protein product [Ranitomeya imitator]
MCLRTGRSQTALLKVPWIEDPETFSKRPLWVEFPKYQDAFGVDKQYMLGNALLVAPVLDPGVISTDVIFPGNEEFYFGFITPYDILPILFWIIQMLSRKLQTDPDMDWLKQGDTSALQDLSPWQCWYDFRNFSCVGSSHKQTVNVTLEEDTAGPINDVLIPVYQRGGSIIPLQTTIGKSSGWMENSPYELRVALNRKGTAVGEIYIDDGHSFQYLHENMFTYRKFTFKKNVLYSRSADKLGCFPVKSTLENVHVMGFKKSPSEVIVHQAGREKRKLSYTYHKKLCVLSLENVSIRVSEDWEIHIK